MMKLSPWLLFVSLFFASTDLVALVTAGGRHRRPSGARKVQRPRIINGEDAPIGRYPYLVSLQTTYPSIRHRCGGTLIAPDIVLTAGHCFVYTGALVVRTNPHKLDDPIPSSELFGIVDSVRHPMFGQRTGIDHDIWILKLDGNSTMPLLRVNDAPNIPVQYQTMTVGGWGTTVAGVDVPPDVLQISNQSYYISNEECIGVTVDGSEEEYNSTVSTTVTEDMMCAIEAEHGGCQGDSGGPLIIEGSGPKKDLQVGIVSWGTGCALLDYPGVYARVSAGFKFIQAHVCNMSSAPPKYFLCDQVAAANTSIFPTHSPPPSRVVIQVLVQLSLDEFPTETSWYIQDSDGDIIHEVPLYSYMEPSTTVSELVMLASEQEYTFVLNDAFGDGSGDAFIFLGDAADYNKILGYVDARFNSTTNITFIPSLLDTFAFDSPTISPSGSLAPSTLPTTTPMPTSTLQNVTLIINFDTYSSPAISWEITSEAGKLVQEVETGGYEPTVGDVVVHTMALELDHDYVFTISDANGDGICCQQGEGYVAIYYGTNVRMDRTLLYHRGDFDSGTSLNFTVSLQSTFVATQSPSSSPSFSTVPSQSIAPSSSLVNIIVMIKFDLYPHETGWILKDSYDEVLTSVLTGNYSSEAAYSVSNTTISVPVGELYTFTLLDSLGDGICCEFGGGYAIVFLEEISEEQVLLFMSGDFKSERTGAFLASTDGIVQGFTYAIMNTPMAALVTASPSDSKSPSLSPTFGLPTESPEPIGTPSSSLSPSITHFPTAGTVSVSIVVALDLFPEEIGFVIARAGTDEILFESPPGALRNMTSLSQATIELELNNKSGDDYVFAIIDVAGDGICCADGEGSVSIYLGNKTDGNVLLFDRGKFGFGARHSFIASRAGIVKGFVLPSSTTPSSQPSLQPTWSVSTEPTREFLTVSSAPTLHTSAHPTRIDSAVPTGDPISISSASSAPSATSCAMSSQGLRYKHLLTLVFIWMMI